VARILGAVKELGIHVYLDDFGTGYSSLNSLYNLPVDAVKIDRTFIYQSEKHRDYAAVIGAVMMLARNLRKLVVAEGVETRDQLAQILAFDCDYAQGYYFSKPFDAVQAAEMLRSERMAPHFAQVGNLTTVLGANR